MTAIKAKRHAAAMKANRSRRRNENHKKLNAPKSKHDTSFLTMTAQEQARRLSLLSATVRQKLLRTIVPWVDALRKGSSNGRGSR